MTTAGDKENETKGSRGVLVGFRGVIFPEGDWWRYMEKEAKKTVAGGGGKKRRPKKFGRKRAAERFGGWPGVGGWLGVWGSGARSGGGSRLI